MKHRRSPWLSGLIVARIGAERLFRQMVVGVDSLIMDSLTVRVSDRARVFRPLPVTQPAGPDSAAPSAIR